MKTYILYNPNAGCGDVGLYADALGIATENSVCLDLCRLTNYAAFFAGLEPEDRVILCGGDGTLNRFANRTQGLPLRNPIYYYALGSGNDFARDLGHKRADLPDYPINDYLRSLPRVEINGTQSRFLNGVGYGIDGWCCEVGDRLRQKAKDRRKARTVNYTLIAVYGLLRGFRPRQAVVTVDGTPHRFSRVWLAPTMHGRYYGGGMIPVPDQDRLEQTRPVSVMIFHSASALKALFLFPSLFRGTHTRYEKNVTILSGKRITVEYESPCAAQIDGETVCGVTGYTVFAEEVPS